MWREGGSPPRWRALALVLAVAWCCTGLAQGCSDGAFVCADKSKCIDSSLVQDGVADCKDGSDEACRPLQFRCPCITGTDGKRGPRCLEPEMVRDGVVDCADGADERLDSTSTPDGQCPNDKVPSPAANQVVRSKRRASEVSTRIDGPVTTSMFVHDGGDRRLRPTGILTSTAGTFVLDGTTTEFATKVYGTHLEGGVYAKIVSTSSRVFFAVPSAGSMARIRPTGLLSSATSTRVDGTAATLYTTEFSGTYIDGTYAQLVSSTSRVVQETAAFIKPTATFTPTETYQTVTPPIPAAETQQDTKDDMVDSHDDQVVTVTGTRGALVDGGETKYDVFTGTHVKGDKTYLFFFGNTALSPSATTATDGGSMATALPSKASELVVRTGADDRIVVNVDNRQLNLVLPKSARASAAESGGSGMKDTVGTSGGMRGVFIEGSELLGGFSIQGAEDMTSRSDGHAPTEMLTVTVGRGVAQTRIVRGRYDGLGEKELETEIRGNVSPSRVSVESVASERTVYRFPPRIPALRPPRPSLGELGKHKPSKENAATEATEDEESENLLKARKLDPKEEGSNLIRPSKVHRINLPTFTVGQDGLKVEEEAKVVVRVDHNVEARVGPRKEYRTLSSRQRLGKSLPFRGFQVIHEKEDLVNAESGGSAAIPTITYIGFAEFTTSAHGTVIIFMPRSQEVAPSTASISPKITAVSAYNRPSSRIDSLKEGPAYNANSISGSEKQGVATGIKTFYSHTPGMVTRTVTGHTLSMQTTIPTVLVEPVFGISANGREKNGRSEDDLSDAQLVYPTSDAPEEIHTTEGNDSEEIDDLFIQPSVSQPMADIVTSTSTFIENAHARPASIDIDASVATMEASTSPDRMEFENEDGETRHSEPLEPSATLLEATETLPTGLIRSIGGKRALDGTTTFFTTMIYGTYINGNYAQIIQTTTSILNEVNPTDIPSTPSTDITTRQSAEKEESSTAPSVATVEDDSETTFVTKDIVDDSTPATITTTNNDYDEILSTIPVSSSTTEENEIANEVETGRRVNTRPEEQVFLVEDGGSKDKGTSGKGASSESSDEDSGDEKPSLIYTIIPTTIYQTYTYFTTFFIPNGETTSTSIRSREVTSSEFALLTRSFTVTPTVTLATEAVTTDTTTQDDITTTPMLPVTEETPELPPDRITTLSDEPVTIEPTVAKPKEVIKDNSSIDEDNSSENEEEDSEEIELIFKTLYTTYTYLTTFFHDTTTSVSSREVVVTNILTSTLNNVNLATEPALAGLVRDHELSTAVPSPSYSSDEEEDIPTSVGVGRPTTMFFSETDPTSSTPTAPLLSTPSINLETKGDSPGNNVAKGQLRTFYTTYTYFTTVFVDGETEISSRTEVYTNIITPSALIQPKTTNKPSSILFTAPGHSSHSISNKDVKLKSSLRPSVPVTNTGRYSSTIMRRGGSKITETTPKEYTTKILEPRITSETDSVSIPSEKHEEKQDVGIIEIQNDDSSVRLETTTSTTTSVETSEVNSVVTTEKYFGVTKFEEAGEPEKLVSEADDQESSESNTEVVLPVPLPSPTPNQVTETSLLLQTTFTTFTYFTTLYRGGTSDVISRLETVTNIMAITVEPTTKASEVILPTASTSIKPSSTEIVPEVKSTELPESLYPITYFTTFTYWTTAYKGGSTVVNSREETVSNIVTPTGKPVITREVEIPTKTLSTETTKPTIVLAVPTTTKPTEDTVLPSFSPSPPVDATPQLTTFYTTYTYFTTSYVGESTIVNSRLETVTNVEAGDTQTARAIGASPPVQQQIITPTKTTDMPTGLLKTVRRSSVGEDSKTTVFSTDVYGTYIDGRYAQVLESSTQVLVEPSVTSTPVLTKVNLQPTGVVSLNAGSIVDAEGLATTYFSTMAIGTYIGDLYAQVVESTSSVVIDTSKTTVPVNTAAPKTGLVRLIQGSIVKGETTTFYESRVIGTVTNGRYAQIIESTSSFKASDATKTIDDNGVIPSPTSTSVLTATVTPTLESSLGDVSSSATPDKEEGEQDEGEVGEEGDEEDDGDEDDANNQGRGRVTSRLTFSSRRRTFTPVIRPFASRNRPTFHPRRRPTSATTITRVTQTPTVTATPAHTGDFAATSLRGRFNSRRGGASSLDVRPSAASNNRRFSRTRSSSPGGAYGSSSFFGGSRGRGSSTRIIPTAASTLPFGASRSRPGSYRSSFAGGGRSSSEYPYGRTSSSAALFAANSRYRIRPSSTSTFLRPTQAPSSPPTFDRNTVEDEEDESTEGDEDEDVGTDREDSARVTEPTESTPLETALTPTTEGTTSPFRRPLFRLRRPLPYQPQVSPQTTPPPIQRTTAARRLGFLRRPSSEENLPTEDRKPNRGRYKASSAATTKSPAKTPTTPRPRSSQPPRLQVLSRPRPTSSLFPRRGLFRRPGEEQEKQAEEEANKEEESNEEERDEIVEEAESSVNEGIDEDNGEDSDTSEDSIADNDYEASEDVKSKNEPPKVFIRPFSPRRRRLKRQTEYGTRGSSSSGGALRGYSSRFRRPSSSRKSAPAQEAEARVGTAEDEIYVDEEYNLQSQSEVARQPPSRSRSSGQQQPRVRPTSPSAPSRTQFTITGNRNKNPNTNVNNNNNNNNYRETTQRTNFRRPSSANTTPRRRTKGDTTLANQQQPRPKPPRLRSQSETQSTPTVPTKSRSRGRGYTNRGRSQSTASRGRSGYRTSDLETNDYSTRRQYQPSRDGKVTVTHQIPTEATIPVVNGKNTEYRTVITASVSTQILTPGQYEATEIAGAPGLLLIGSDVTATPTPGIIHVTQYVARETPTSSIEFTPTVIRGRKTSFSHVVPSTAYGVEEVVNTIPSENGLLPSAPLANILLSQLLLGQFGLPGNVNPLLGLQQPNAAAALAPPTPTTEFKTRSTTFVTTLTEKTSTVIPITLRGKAIMTTIVDSSVNVVTATEFITDTIVVTPTAAPQQQLNSLLLPALLQAQLLNQQQQPQTIPNTLPGQLSPLQAAQLLQQQQPTLPLTRPGIPSKEVTQEEEELDAVIPSTERRKQSSSRRRNRPHKRVEAVEDDHEDDDGRPIRGSTEASPRPKTRKKQPSSSRKQNPPPAPKQYETSVITLYVSGRRPGDFSTVLSTISIEAGSSLVKREAILPERIPTVQYVTDLPLFPIPNHDPIENDPEKFSNSLPYKDPNIYLSPSTVHYIPNALPPHKQSSPSAAKFTPYETESLESIVGDVSKHVVQHSHSTTVTSPSQNVQPVSATNEKILAEESNAHAHTGYFLADGPAELAPLKRKVLSIDEGVEDEDDSDDILDVKIDSSAYRKKRETQYNFSGVEGNPNHDQANKRRRVRVRVPVRRNHGESHDGLPTGVRRTPKRLENEREVLLLSEAKQRGAVNDRQPNGRQTDLSDATRRIEHIKNSDGTSLEDEDLAKSTFPSQRIKVLRVRPKGNEEGINSDTVNRGNKKRVKVLRRRKPITAENEEPNDVSHLGHQKAQEEESNVNKNVGVSVKDLNSAEKSNHGTSGRRRVVVTRKRILSTTASQETIPISPSSTRRHRITVTRRRPVHRQSAQVIDEPYTTPVTLKEETKEVEEIHAVTPTKTIIQSLEEKTKTIYSAVPPRDAPTARRVPSGGLNIENFGSKKNSIANVQDKAPDVAQKVPSAVKEEEIRPLEVDEGKGKEAAEEVVKQTGEWVASLVREQYSATPPKTVEPSFWSGDETLTGETELLRREPKTSTANASPEETGATPEGPRFVRPTRFSVTRRPSGDFLQKVQGARTKAPIVFPSRRRPSASTRQPAYRSRLSRLRGRPSSTSTVPPLETITSDVLDTTVTQLTLEPTSSVSIEPSSTTPPTPIYVTETLTETLLKTYTYVVSRVESSVEAGVDQAAAAPPSLAAVSSTTEVKQVVKTRTVTRLLEPTAAIPSAVPEASIAKFNEKSLEGTAIGAQGRMNVEAARFNLATRVMSNGVEVIVAGDKTTLPGGPDVLRILSTASRPITLAPSTLTDQMHLTLPTAISGGGKPQGDQESLLLSLQSQAANFVTKTYATTYTYLTTFLQGSSTVVSSREDVITNVATEEVRPTKTIQRNPAVATNVNEALTSKVDGPPSFVTSTYRTTFTYLNTIIDGEIPVVLTTRQTVANTVTSPANPSALSGSSPEESDSGYLQPSEPTMYDTNTYFNTFTLTKTLSDSASGVKVISTEDVLTQVIITEASTPAPSIAVTKISPTSTTNIVKTYFVTYTYYNTFLEKGSTVVKTNVATSSDIVTEKFYLAPSKTASGYKTPSLTNVPVTNFKDPNPIKTAEGLATALPPLSVFATKTYLTTFTYFTTLLENGQTVTRSNTRVSTNLATEAITAGLDSVYLDSLRSSFSMQSAHSPIIATVMLSGTPMEITAFQGSAIEVSKTAANAPSSQTLQKISVTQSHKIEESNTQIISPSKTTSGNVVVGSTIIFFDDIKPLENDSDNIDEPSAAASSNSEITSDDDETLHTSSSSNNVAHTDTPEYLLSSLSSSPVVEDDSHLDENNYDSRPSVSYITSTITASTVVANGNGLATTLVPGDAVIVSIRPDGNVSLIPVSDPSNKNPEGALIGTSSGVIPSIGGTGGGLLAAASGGPNLGVGDLINLGSLSLNGLNALGPVFNAMAGLIQNNLKSSPPRQNYTTTPRPPPTTPRTPPPIDLPRPPAPQSAPLIRDPVYIPVGGLASLTSQNSDAVAAESTNGESIEAFYGQHFPIHGFSDTQERRPPPSPVKPSMPTTLTLDNPLLLQNGIPIQPGQVITTNSDVIVGKPSVLGPRPSPNGGVPQIFPQNYAPPLHLPSHSPPAPVLVPTNQPAAHYPQKPVIVAPPRSRPGNDVPPEMRPPPPPRYPSYSGVNPTRVSVVSGVETVFIGNPLPPHMVPEHNPPQSPHLIPHLPSIPTGPLRGDIGNYQPLIHVSPPIIIGSPLENPNPQPPLQYNNNTIDRSTGYKIQPSQSFNIPIDAVTLSVGSETNANEHDPADSFLDIRSPLSGARPGSVFNAGEPHSEPNSGPHSGPLLGPHLGPHSGPHSGSHSGPLLGPHSGHLGPNSGHLGPHSVPHLGPHSGPHLGPHSRPHSGPQLTLGQAQVHKVPMGTGGEVVVEIGRPPVTDILKTDAYPEETRIITNEETSDETQGVVHEEEENLLNGQPIIGIHGQSESILHPGNIIVGHGRPQNHKPQTPQPNYYGLPRPNLQTASKPPSHLNHVLRPHPSIGAIHRPPPLSAVYTTGLNTHANPPDHLMPPPPPWPGTSPPQANIPHKNEGPIIIPLNHHIENTPLGNTQKEAVKPFTDDNIKLQWFDGTDEDLEDPEEVEGAQDGEVLQESNNRPVRPAQPSQPPSQENNRPNTLPEIQIIKEKPFLPHPSNSNADNHFHKPSQNSGDSISIHIGEIPKETHTNFSKGTNDNMPPSVQHQQQFTLPEAPPYRFEIPDMQPPQLPPKPLQPTHQPPNSQRPPPGAVSRPAIRPQDYNPDFLDKPIRIASRPLPPTRAPIVDAASIQENAVRPEISRPPVRVVVRPVNPHRPRPNYHNHHATQSRPSQVWQRPLRPLKPPGPVQVLRVSSSSSRVTAWQPSFSSTSQKEVAYTSTPPHRDILIQPTRANNLGDFTIKDSSIQHKPINPSFSAEREPIVIMSSPSSPGIQVESSGGPIVWDGNQFSAIPTAELPSANLGSKITNAAGPTILLSGASTIYGGLYSRPSSTKKSATEPTAHGDLFLSPSSHGVITGGNGQPAAGHSNSSPHHYKEDEEELEHEFEEGGGLGAAGSNDAATSIVVVSVTATPTTRYVTRTQTETRTVTQTVVESHPGSPPLTRTVIVTQTIAPEKARPVTIVSTIVGTVTEVHTTVESSTTTAVTTVTITAPTHWILHTIGYDQGHKPEDAPENAENSQGTLSSTSQPVNVVNNHPSDAFFDVSFPLRPTTSIVSNKENDLNPDLGPKDSNTMSKENEKSGSYGIEGVESDDIREGFSTNIITNEVPRGDDDYPSCKPECDAARNEICVMEEERDGDVVEGPHCVCRPGFARLFPDRPCMPTYTYQLKLLLDRIGKHRLFYTTELEHPQTEEFQQLHDTAQDALERVAMQSDLRDLFQGISIAAFESPSETMEVAGDSSAQANPIEGNSNEEKLVASKENESHSPTTDPEDGVIVNFYVKLSDNMDPDKLKEMFEKTLKQSNYSVGGTELFARRKEGLLEIYDFDECSDPYFNDCSELAECLNLRGTYTCSCKEGYADLSENLEFPGRMCSAEFLGCEQCKYHGQCYTNTNGEIGCKCFQWYSGDKCQINLKVLLIALVTVGAILLILVCVCIMFACMKRKKTDRRHTAPGFMRYIGPPGMIKGGGTLDKTVMIPDTSSESSFEGALPPPPLTYLPVVHHRLSTSTQASKMKGEGQQPERRMNEVKTTPPMGTSTMNTGFTEQDRSLTVMIPRAKYRPAPPLIATAAASSPMTSFGVVVVEGENRERRVSAANEQKLHAFLDGTEVHAQGRQNSPIKQKQIGPTIGTHETSGNSKKVSSSRKPSTGALVSAGFEVSATVVKDKWPTEGGGNNQLEDDADDTSGTGRGIDGHLHHTLASNESHFTTLRTGDRTVSEARSYDETIVHPPKKSLLHTPLSACGSKPSSQHGLHHSNDEAHTMAERDVGSTFLMPQTQLYKPSRGSDNSNFDSL